jgi:hypothetical protein
MNETSSGQQSMNRIIFTFEEGNESKPRIVSNLIESISCQTEGRIVGINNGRLGDNILPETIQVQIEGSETDSHDFMPANIQKTRPVKAAGNIIGCEIR